MKIINEKMGEYIAIETLIGSNNELMMKENRKMLFMHSKCSEVRGFAGIIYHILL